MRAYNSRGRSREEAAQYIGVGVTKFDEMVLDGRMPQPYVIDNRLVWCVYELDQYFERLPKRKDRGGAANSADPWSKMVA